MKKLIFGLTVFIGGILGAGMTLIANGANLAGNSRFIDVPYSIWLAIFVLLAFVGMIIAVTETFFEKSRVVIDK